MKTQLVDPSPSTEYGTVIDDLLHEMLYHILHLSNQPTNAKRQITQHPKEKPNLIVSAISKEGLELRSQLKRYTQNTPNSRDNILDKRKHLRLLLI